MQTPRQSLQYFRIMADLFVVVSSFAIVLLTLPHAEFINFHQHERYLIPSTLIFWYLFAKMHGLYDDFRSRNFAYELISLIRTVFFLTISFIVMLFILREPFFTRSLVLGYAVVLLIHLALERYSLRKFFEFARRKGRNLRSLLIVGAGPVGKEFYDSIVSNPHFGYRLIGFLDDERKTFLNGKYLGSINNLDSVLFSNQVDDVIIALPNYSNEKIDDVIKTCEQHTTLVRIIPDYFRFISGSLK